MKQDSFASLLEAYREGVLSMDPVFFVENFLTVDGKSFDLGTGYKPFNDIYRYIALQAVQENSKPIVMVKGRQVGATTMAAALECYFVACGLFGNNGRPPMRMMHLFPTLSLAAAYTKDKLDPIIGSARPVPGALKSNGLLKSYIEAKLDASNPANNNMHFKKFMHGNQIWIESTGLDGDRIRGRTCDAAFFDECFPYSQNIETDVGKVKIGKLYDMFKDGKTLPLVKTYNEDLDRFELKRITNAWKRGERDLVKIICGNREVLCTSNHRFLTTDGWKQANDIEVGELIKTTPADVGQLSKSLNDDQIQIILGSFLGDGHLSKHGLNKYRISERHGISQQNYCAWKADMFGVKPKLVEKNGYSQKPALSFASKLFGFKADFPSEKNTCPQWILDQLDERGLAIWFMDDGSTNKHIGGVINTCSFDEETQIRLVAKLKSFGIDCEYRFYKYKGKKKEGYYSIYLNKTGYRKLCDIVRKYIHSDLYYKVYEACDETSCYKWNSKFKQHGVITVVGKEVVNKPECVYDIEVEDNHNFIVTSVKHAKNGGGLIAHNCQDMSDIAIGAVTKILAQSKYGARGEGLQVYFGTPKTKGGSYWKMWEASCQNYYHLRCEHCGEYFPLYRPDINWEDVWIIGTTVRCSYCKRDQDKNEAVERGKWVPLNNPENSAFVGYHINQLFIPHFTRETIEKTKPENNKTNTERVYMNEVLGEFFDGDGGTISVEEIRQNCADRNRKLSKSISSESNRKVYAGFDWGQRAALDQATGRRQGKSYSCAVILTADGPNIFNVEFATRLLSNDPQEKVDVVEEMFRRYTVTLGVGDIGDAFDLTHKLQNIHGDRFLASRSSFRINGRVKYSEDEFPKVILFEKDYYIGEMIGLMKEGKIKFPFGSYDRIGWLVKHCASMDTRITRDKSGEPVKRYVKGDGPNDGLMALLNAYLAWKFDVTQGFKIKSPQQMRHDRATNVRQIGAILGYVPKLFGSRG